MSAGSTRVVNINYTPMYDVYIGRPGKGESGYFGNPFKPGEGVTRDDTIDRYAKWFDMKILQDAMFRRRVQELRGKILGCFCKPARCHGDVIVTYLNRVDAEEKS